jgi:Protein of unknown function (DUF1064)
MSARITVQAALLQAAPSCECMSFRLSTPNKFKARKTEIDGVVFDSGQEAPRYQELKILERAGLISIFQNLTPTNRGFRLEHCDIGSIEFNPWFPSHDSTTEVEEGLVQIDIRHLSYKRDMLFPDVFFNLANHLLYGRFFHSWLIHPFRCTAPGKLNPYGLRAALYRLCGTAMHPIGEILHDALSNVILGHDLNDVLDGQRCNMRNRRRRRRVASSFKDPTH